MPKDVSPTAALQDVDPSWAWTAYEPSSREPWDLARASHLYRRVSFGATWSELEAARREGPAKTIARLLEGGAEQQAFYHQAAATAEALGGSVESLPGWWLMVMLTTPHPVLEKLTLFWHGHFATSAAKVDKGELMLAQHRLLREHALASFAPLLAGMAKDPAMLLWLDSATNKKFKPNENFAREVFELFGLGLGNYSEQDIKQAARAFTGWEVRYGKFHFHAFQHDDGMKSVLGQTGRWNGDDVIRIILEQPAAAKFLVGKLFRYLVSEAAAPPAKLLDPLAESYRRQNYDTAWLVRTIVSSNLFYSPHALRQKVKAPVELAIGLLRSLEGTTNFTALAGDLRPLGQGVFYPPNVKGWDGGAEWINSATMLSRVNLAWALVSGRDGRYRQKVALDRLLEKYAVPPAEAPTWLGQLLLGEVPAAAAEQLAAVYAEEKSAEPHLRLARVVHALAALPEFHVT